MIENDNGGCKAGLRGLAEFLGSGPERGGSPGSCPCRYFYCSKHSDRQ
jgi:hypothetical protein